MRDRPGGPDQPDDPNDPNSGDDPNTPDGPDGPDRPGSGDQPSQPEQPRPGSWDALTIASDPDTTGAGYDWKGVLRSEGYDVDNFDFEALGDDFGPDMSDEPDEPVEWRGAGDRYLSPEQNVEVDQEYWLFEKVVEPATTPVMEEVKESSEHGADLAGLPNRLKEADRFKEKVAKGLEERPDVPAYEVAENLHDVVRYTLTYPDESYTDGVLADTAKLEGNGFEMVLRRNTWDDPDYKGINSRWREPEAGRLVELQFHTPESYAAKQQTHEAYEALRTPGISDEEYERLEASQRDITAGIPIPPGAEGIPDVDRRGR